MQYFSFGSNVLKEGNISPDRILACFAPVSWWEGDWKKNPLDFECCWTDSASAKTTNLTEANIILGSGRELMRKTASLEEFLMLMFRNLFKNMGLENRASDIDLQMSYKDFKRGNFFLLFDLTLDERGWDSKARHHTVTDSLTLKGQFDEVTPYPLFMFLVREFNSDFTINQSRRAVYRAVV